MPQRKPGSIKNQLVKGQNVAYRLKITLKNVSPAVWRRVEIADCTLAELHEVVQTVMGWANTHLHSFNIGGEEFSTPSPYGDDDLDEMGCCDAREVTLADVLGDGIKSFRYTYDFGDGWEHRIQVEKRFPIEEGAAYPRCTGGARACPPEDCGGPWGYEDLLDKLADPKHPEHKEMKEWLGRSFDPEKFDVARVNKLLG